MGLAFSGKSNRKRPHLAVHEEGAISVYIHNSPLWSAVLAVKRSCRELMMEMSLCEHLAISLSNHAQIGHFYHPSSTEDRAGVSLKNAMQ